MDEVGELYARIDEKMAQLEALDRRIAEEEEEIAALRGNLAQHTRDSATSTSSHAEVGAQ